MALWQSTQTLTVYPAGSRTRTPDVYELDSRTRYLGGRWVIVTTAVTATPSVVPTIDGYDPLSRAWYTLLTGAAITATGTIVLSVYPGITVAANVSASTFLPPRWRLVMTHADADAITYSVSALLIP
jgi:hypothetical protein